MDHANVFFALWFLYLADVDPWQDIEESEVRVFIPSASSLRCSHVLAVSLNWGLHLSTLPTWLPQPPDSTHGSCFVVSQD